MTVQYPQLCPLIHERPSYTITITASFHCMQTRRSSLLNPITPAAPLSHLQVNPRSLLPVRDPCQQPTHSGPSPPTPNPPFGPDVSPKSPAGLPSPHNSCRIAQAARAAHCSVCPWAPVRSLIQPGSNPGFPTRPPPTLTSRTPHPFFLKHPETRTRAVTPTPHTGQPWRGRHSPAAPPPPACTPTGAPSPGP